MTNSESRATVGLRQQVLKDERCPRCKALLFKAQAEGVIEIRCKKCGYTVRRELSRS